MGLELKSDMISVRVSSEIRMKLKDMSESSGYNMSAIVSAAVIRLLSDVYDADGYIVNTDAIQVNRKLRDCIPDSFVPLAIASHKCDIPESTIRTWIRQGWIEKVRIGNKPYVKLSNIEKIVRDKYVKKNKRST